MKKLFLIAGASIVMISCKKDKETILKAPVGDSVAVLKDSGMVKKDFTTVKNVFRLEKFVFPSEVEGCSCYFAENKAGFEAQKYIYIDDYGNNAYFKIKGNLIKIPMEEGDFDPSNFQKTLENTEYKLYMNGRKINEIDEVMMFEGKMTVENKRTGEKATSTIYGECGC